MAQAIPAYQDNANETGRVTFWYGEETHLLTLPIPNAPMVCHVLRPRIPTTTLSGRYRAMSRSRMLVIRPETYSRIIDTCGDHG